MNILNVRVERVFLPNETNPRQVMSPNSNSNLFESFLGNSFNDQGWRGYYRWKEPEPNPREIFPMGLICFSISAPKPKAPIDDPYGSCEEFKEKIEEFQEILMIYTMDPNKLF